MWREAGCAARCAVVWLWAGRHCGDEVVACVVCVERAVQCCVVCAVRQVPAVHVCVRVACVVAVFVVVRQCAAVRGVDAVWRGQWVCGCAGNVCCVVCVHCGVRVA